MTGPVVFAGYGLVVPDSQNFGYDSYQGLDVKDKIVVVLRYFPEDADQKTRGDPRALRRPALQGAGGAAARRQRDDRRHRAALAERRQRGADEFRYGDRRIGPRGGQHQRRAAAPIFRRRRQAARGVQKELDSGNPHVAGFAIPDLQVTIDAKIIREQQTGNNVVAYLPATTATTGVMKPWVASARTTITSAAAAPATRSPTRIRPTRSITAPTTTPPARRRCSTSPSAGEAAAQAQPADRLLVGRRSSA